MKPKKLTLAVLTVLAVLLSGGIVWQTLQNGDPDPEPPAATAQDAGNAPDGPIMMTLSYEVKNNPPYYLGSGTSINWDKPGIVLEVFKLLENRLDVQVRFVRNPWERGLRLLETNQVDGVFNASFRAERMELGAYPMQDGNVDPSKRIFSNTYYLYKLRDSPLQWDGEQFSNLDGDIGAVRGYAIAGDLRDMGVSVYEGPDQLDNLKKLARGRLAGMADLGTMTDFYLTDYAEFSNIVRMEPHLREKDYYLILSHQFVREHPQLAADIWDEIKDIRESGAYDEIAQKYSQ